MNPMYVHGGSVVSWITPPGSYRCRKYQYERPLPDLSDKITRLEIDDHRCDGEHVADLQKCLYDKSSSKHIQAAVTNLRCARKTEFCRHNNKSVRIARRELTRWRRLDHANIVPFFGINQGVDRHEALVSLWMPHGTLRSFLDIHADKLTISRKLQPLLEISNGLDHLHSLKLMHGGLTSNSVLIDENYHADLTNSGHHSLVGASTVRPGAVRITSPELATHQRTTKGGIYSYGAIAYLVLSGKEPWTNIGQDAEPSKPSFLPFDNQHRQLISDCWQLADKHPTANSVLASLHRFIAPNPPEVPLTVLLESPSNDSSSVPTSQSKPPSPKRSRDLKQEPGKSGRVGDLIPQKKHDGTPVADLDRMRCSLPMGDIDERHGVSFCRSTRSRSSSPMNQSQSLVSWHAALQPRSTGSYGSVSSFDYRGKKRVLASYTDDENTRPLKRRLPWPTHDPLYSVHVKNDDGNTGIRQIVFSPTGEWLAVVCDDRTVRIWNTSRTLEMVKLVHDRHIVSVAWMSDQMGVVLLTEDGSIGKWTCSAWYTWHWEILLDAGNDVVSFAYRHDRIAVAYPRNGANIWLRINGAWQSQQWIMLENTTCITFVENGEALIGGTSDGVFWYSHLSEEKSYTYAFLDTPIYHLDVNTSGPHTRVIVSQEGGWLYSIRLASPDQESQIEQTYTLPRHAYASDDARSCVPGAVFTNRGKTLLFGSTEGHLLVWDVQKEVVCSGLAHGERVCAVAAFDRGLHACVVTGTMSGRLSWWKPPLLE